MAGVQRVKLIDVALEAGVHPGTASRALNPATRDRVSQETSRRILKVAQRLGYVPNTIARGLRTSKSFVVGMVVPDITNPLFPPMVRAAEQVLSLAGYTLVLTDTDNDSTTERRQVEQLRARGTDGFIIATARWQDPLLEEIADHGVPAVLVNRNTASRRLPYVGGDDRTGIQLAVEHLAKLGHQRMVHLGGPQDTSTGRDRASAFRQAVDGLGLDASPSQVRVCRSYTEAAGAEATRLLLESAQDFTAIVCGNDLIAGRAVGPGRCRDQVPGQHVGHRVQQRGHGGPAHSPTDDRAGSLAADRRAISTPAAGRDRRWAPERSGSSDPARRPARGPRDNRSACAGIAALPVTDRG